MHEAPRLTYEELDGEAEILPGIVVVPTPGHTPGHQSVVMRTADGAVVVAGQSHEDAAQHSGQTSSRGTRRSMAILRRYHPSPTGSNASD
jgi:N-acyl homoserine lactone hydrolase